MKMVIAGFVLTMVGTIWGEWGRLEYNPRSLIAILYMLVFGSIVGYSSYVYSLQKLPISIVSLHRYINPAVAVLLGWLILDEKFTGQEAIAIAIIALGVFIVQIKGHIPNS